MHDSKSEIFITCGLGEECSEESLSWGQVFLIPFADMPPEGITVNALLNK